jgi:hypothetical protein
MSKILNTDFFLEKILDTDLANNESCNEKKEQSFLYAMDDCTHLDFSGLEKSSPSYVMDDCTDLDFSDCKKSLPMYILDDCTNLSF